MSHVRLFASILAIAAVSVLVGCTGGGDEFGREMSPVKGKVTVKGEPVKANKNLYLVFEKSGKRPESIEVQADGTYSGNAPTGENTVRLQVYGPLTELGGVKPEYTTEAKLKATVESGKELNFEVGE